MSVHYAISLFISLHFIQQRNWDPQKLQNNELSVLILEKLAVTLREAFKVKPLPLRNNMQCEHKKYICFPLNFLMIGPLQVWFMGPFPNLPFLGGFRTLIFTSQKKWSDWKLSNSGIFSNQLGKFEFSSPSAHQLMVNCWFGSFSGCGIRIGVHPRIPIPFIFGDSRNPTTTKRPKPTITLPETNIAPENGWLEY